MDQRRNRRGACHRVRQPHEERELGGLSGGAHQQRQRDGCGGSSSCWPHGFGPLKDFIKAQASKGPEGQEHGDQEAQVPDPIDDKRLLPRLSISGPSRTFLVPEADQQVRTQPDPLPANKHGQQAVAGNQHQHGGNEEVEIHKETRVSGGITLKADVRAHVSDGIDMDQGADSRDHQQHGHRERIHLQRPRDLQRSNLDPVRDWHGRTTWLALQSKELQQRDGKSQTDRCAGCPSREPFAQPAAKDQIEEQPQQREADDERRQPE